MTPTPSPVPLHVVMDGGSPVWLQPLLTGCFVLAAALIALASLRASDHRKLTREDQRQWDNETKQAYVAILAEVSKVRLELSRVRPSEDLTPKSLLVALEDAMTLITGQTALLETFAPDGVITAAKKLGSEVATVWQQGYLMPGDGPNTRWATQAFVELNEPVEQLLAEVRKALRVPGDATKKPAWPRWLRGLQGAWMRIRRGPGARCG